MLGRIPECQKTIFLSARPRMYQHISRMARRRSLAGILVILVDLRGAYPETSKNHTTVGSEKSVQIAFWFFMHFQGRCLLTVLG